MMETRKTVFCEMDFYDRFNEIRPAVLFPDEESIRKQTTWNNLARMIYNSNIYFNCTAEELNEKTKTDELYRYLWKRSAGGLCGLECEKENFPNIKEDDLSYMDGDEIVLSNAVYLTRDGNVEQAHKQGVINITPDNYQNADNLFKDNGLAIRKGEETDWSFLKVRARHNLNSMIIVDNYVLKRMEDNLMRVLDNLLPDQVSGIFVLTIFTKSKNETKERQWIMDQVRMIRPKLKYDVEIFPSDPPGYPDFFHDRAIISNNILIGVGGGFDLFKRVYYHKEAEKSTNVSIVFPFIQHNTIDWADGSYQNILLDARKCLDKLNKTSVNYLLKI